MFAWSKTSSTVVNKKPDMRTISNSRHRTRARNSISSTTPNTRSIPSKYRLWHFLNIYMWSGLPILFTDGFNTFKRGIIHSFEAADLASIRCIKSISTECRSKASDFMCTQTTVTHFFLLTAEKKSNPGNYIITASLFWKNIANWPNPQEQRREALDKQEQILCEISGIFPPTDPRNDTCSQNHPSKGPHSFPRAAR